MTTHTLKWIFDRYVPADDCCEVFKNGYHKSFVVDRKHRRVFAYMGDVRTGDVLRIDYITHCPFCGHKIFVEDKV